MDNFQIPHKIVIIGQHDQPGRDLTGQLARQLMSQAVEGSLELSQCHQVLTPSVTILTTVQSNAIRHAKTSGMATIAILESPFLSTPHIGFRTSPHKTVQRMEFPGAYWGTRRLQTETGTPRSDYVCVLEEPPPNEDGPELAKVLKIMRTADKKSAILRTCIAFADKNGTLVIPAIFGSCAGQLDFPMGQTLTDCRDWFVAKEYPTYQLSSSRIPKDVLEGLCPTNRAIRSFVEALKIRQRQ